MTPSVDKFLVLTTVSDRVLADQICEVLEASEIPVLLEHVELFHEDEVASGVRILVPAHHAQQALSMVETVSHEFRAGSHFHNTPAMQ